MLLSIPLKPYLSHSENSMICTVLKLIRFIDKDYMTY